MKYPVQITFRKCMLFYKFQVLMYLLRTSLILPALIFFAFPCGLTGVQMERLNPIGCSFQLQDRPTNNIDKSRPSLHLAAEIG